MPLHLWLSLVTICILGAVSPGPSLAVVMRNTLAGGRINGFITAMSHGLGIVLWALLTATGIGLLIISNPALFEGIRIVGAGVLLFLGGRCLLTRSETVEKAGIDLEEAKTTSPFWDGFLISITNPKIAIFFLALFSQFVRFDAGWIEKLVMAVTAGVIDTLWYVMVALVLSHSAILPRLRRYSKHLERIFGIVLVILAIRVVM